MLWEHEVIIEIIDINGIFIKFDRMIFTLFECI